MLRVERHAEHVFTTLCMVSIRPDRDGAVIRLAGHPPPLLLKDGRTAPLEPGSPGPPLGILDDVRWPAYDVALPGDWSLLLYTDGVMDGRVGAGHERLGEAGLAAVVDAAQSGGEEQPEELVRLVVERAEDLNAGPLADDVALLIVARRGT